MEAFSNPSTGSHDFHITILYGAMEAFEGYWRPSPTYVHKPCYDFIMNNKEYIWMPIYTQRFNQLEIDLFAHAISHHYFKILTTNNMHDSHSFYDMMRVWFTKF